MIFRDADVIDEVYIHMLASNELRVHAIYLKQAWLKLDNIKTASDSLSLDNCLFIAISCLLMHSLMVNLKRSLFRISKLSKW